MALRILKQEDVVYYSIKKYVRHVNLVANGVKTTGIITEYKESWSYGKDSKKRKTKTKMYSPVIQYYDDMGKSYILDSDYSSNSKEWSGDIIIYYDVKDSQKAIRGGFWHLWFGPFILLCLSFIPLGIGGYILKYYIECIFQRARKNK
ncbi:DUF3592 domain-containing protein [Chryseobacterium sp. ERMR1:04]|uniref:DUF3592 domain-containing protein n=1 Tax=Chryseobacterium sp. ERMR1:04 TaxID=1705393 RepID=UPI0006C86CD8|nr:DUF3592 domain-containing protein [Chryseobacterium sp. ERMR1:04]KPH13468.1 hypothetical protein AMQ68_07745 [Chryseobacterium sp. ERMR1:04]